MSHFAVSISPAFFSRLPSDASIEEYSRSFARSLGTNTIWLVFDTSVSIEKNASFMRRLILLRCTAFPSFFDTEKPTFKRGVFVLIYMSTKYLSETDLPRLYTYRNSLLRLSEYSRLKIPSFPTEQICRNIGKATLYAVSFFLPLARLRWSTFRPALVFILFLKPCSFLRCLFFGWYVIFMCNFLFLL